eukprot:CAMPEP_0170612940 /NCGR_PEP_ID=MMETSP0224-20130122/23998_1 /TAXON_ID=285029 /ORGANISM="Togula jolla, Strain CCCM 725" /LENGTH=68 /DNA_ID=CAMNT_0010938491 /DNA_START=642 /DNA_END=848 /DNA_ORIENTATION=+
MTPVLIPPKMSMAPILPMQVAMKMSEMAHQKSPYLSRTTRGASMDSWGISNGPPIGTTMKPNRCKACA